MSKLLSRQGVRDLCLGLGLLCATLALMFWPQEAMEAAREGLRLCYNVILPSLFPFFVLSALVVDLGLAGYIGRALEGIMRPLFNVPGACASAFALGFVGGYPVGARTALSLYQKGMCTKTEAERLLAFCNNSGPAFILGVVGAGVFASSKVGLLLYLAHAAASVCVGFLFRFYKREGKRRERRASPTFEAERITVAFTGAIKNSFLSTLNICAFVVFFTVVIKLLFLSGLLPGLAGVLGALLSPMGFSTQWAERLLTGLIELTSGVWTLTAPGPCRESCPWPPSSWAGRASPSTARSSLSSAAAACPSRPTLAASSSMAASPPSSSGFCCGFSPWRSRWRPIWPSRWRALPGWISPAPSPSPWPPPGSCGSSFSWPPRRLWEKPVEKGAKV